MLDPQNLKQAGLLCSTQLQELNDSTMSSCCNTHNGWFPVLLHLVLLMRSSNGSNFKLIF
jgi:hypothetical protein